MDDFTCAYLSKGSEAPVYLESLPRFIRAGSLYFKKYANVRRQGFGQRMAVCELLKKRGNDLFNDNETEAAIKEYEQAVSIFRYIVEDGITLKNNNAKPEDLEYIDYEGQNSKEKDLIRTMKVALYNNLAACYLKVGDSKDAKFACDEALLLDPNQTKALYRRAKAITSLPTATIEDYNLGLEDLKKAYNLSPQNSTVLYAINQLKQDINRLKAGPETFKGMFIQKNDKGRSSLSHLKGDNEENIDTPRSSTQAKSEDSLDMISESSFRQKRSFGDSQILNECYQTLSRSNLESPRKFNQEIDKLGKILEAKRHEISETSSETKGSAVTNALKEHLEKAMAALHRLEELASLDLTNPKRSLKDAAKKFGLNLNGSSLQEELKRIQEKSLEEIKEFIDELSLSDKSPGQTESISDIKENTKDVLKAKTNTSPEKPMASKTTNNYFINNNYFSETDALYQEFSRLTERIQAVEGLKDKNGRLDPNLTDQKLLEDLAKGFSKLSKSGKRAKLVRVMNLVIIVVAIMLLLATIMIQSRQTELVPQEIKDI